MAGGAVREACRAVREGVEARAAARGVGAGDLAAVLEEGPIEETRTYRHGETGTLHPETGQGASHAGFAFVAHRAVVDVDVELGLARVVELACAQDVGKAINPLALEGQLEGGSIQGLGLALSEAMVIEDGVVRTGSFGEYRIPTIVDAAPVPTVVLELADPATPYGLRGVGEMPSISSTPAVLAALRAATGKALTRAPVRPEDLVVEWEDGT
jgi:CO/xanthine dehydrogenase Mo-binding subunit